MTTISDQFHSLYHDMAIKYIVPVRITFSADGYLQMMQENDGFLAQGVKDPQTYAHLPYSVVVSQKEPILLHAETEAETVRKRNAITFAMKGTFGKFNGQPKTMIELVGQSLGAADLQSICRAWLDADDATHWGEFEKGLDELITKHGRFE